MAELIMPSTEYRTSDLGEAAHASARPCRRFFRTLRARPFAGSELPLMDTRGRLPHHARDWLWAGELNDAELRPIAPAIRAPQPRRDRRSHRFWRIGNPFPPTLLATQLDDD